MLKIRLTRRGKKHHPTYRIVVAHAQWPRDGKFLDDLGYYNPMVKPLDLKIDIEKLDKWLADGAQPTDKVAALIKIARNPDRLKNIEAAGEKKTAKRLAKKASEKAGEATPEAEATPQEPEETQSEEPKEEPKA